ncbi:MAG: hypothetical protein JWN60_1689 [Acidobacteria bacterium]|nr:hypothetical protein [Acidobacteriota bacterium]
MYKRLEVKQTSTDKKLKIIQTRLKKIINTKKKTTTESDRFLLNNNGAIHGIQTHDLSITNRMRC